MASSFMTTELLLLETRCRLTDLAIDSIEALQHSLPAEEKREDLAISLIAVRELRSELLHKLKNAACLPIAIRQLELERKIREQGNEVQTAATVRT